MSGRRAGRLIVGNLDCESDFAALAGRPAGPLPRRVHTAIAGAATLLRVFARDDDRLWLPAPVPRRAMAEVPGLPRPVLESGPLPDLEPADEILAWGETPAVTRLRGARPPAGGASGIENRAPSDIPWQLPVPAPEAAAEVNDRRFDLALSEELGCRLPGSRAVASARELDAHLVTTSVERWVLKARFSAAGRWRVVHLGGAMTPGTRRRVERLFARHGGLVFEPWMERTLDVGYAAALTPGGSARVSCHRLLVGGAGRFRGLELIAGGGTGCDPWLTSRESARLERVLDGVADALRRAGYSGPFGVDAWRYRRPGGETLHPLGEINGRLTFGWVARALVERLREPLGIELGHRIRLMFGKRRSERHGVRIVPLLEALKPGDPECRLELG